MLEALSCFEMRLATLMATPSSSVTYLLWSEFLEDGRTQSLKFDFNNQVIDLKIATGK